MRASYQSAALVLWIWLAAVVVVACDVSEFLLVETSNGPIQGHLISGDLLNSCVVEYLGIPYAKPPIRFEPPEKIDSQGFFDAREFGYDCPFTESGSVQYPGLTPQAQDIMRSFSNGMGHTQSEDCLTLNIWSATTPRSELAEKPVMVFFYGGRFTTGYTNSPFYNGEYFAYAQDIVVVTVNYRSNVFGFPGFPQGQQNLGLRDQRVAIEWVRDNIRRFGGNPEKITIMGHSSGGLAVDAMAYLEDFIDKPPFSGIIAQSGTVLSFALNSQETAEKNWNSIVRTVGCPHSSKKTMSCMRKVKWEEIKAAAAAVPPGKSSSVLRAIPAFYPTADNITLFDDYEKRNAEGRFAKVPILLTQTDREAGYYKIPAFKNGIVPTDEQVQSFMLSTFTCPIAAQAAARHRHGVPAWVGRYMPDWDNTRLYNGSGAYHGTDLHMIFGASEDVSGLRTTKEQKLLTSAMQRAWFLFADDAVAGLSKDEWGRGDGEGQALMLFGPGNSSRMEKAWPEDYDG